MNELKDLLKQGIEYLSVQSANMKQQKKQEEIKRQNTMMLQQAQNIQLQLQYELYRVFSQCNPMHGLQRIQYVSDLAPMGFKQVKNGILFAFSWQKDWNNVQPMPYIVLQKLKKKLNGLIAVYHIRLNNDLSLNPYDTQIPNEFPLMLNTTYYYIAYCKDMSDEVQITVFIA